MQQAITALYIALAAQSVAIVIIYSRLVKTARNLRQVAGFQEVMTQATMDHIFQLRAKHKDMEVPEEYRVSK
jgi:hypothetical protein